MIYPRLHLDKETRSVIDLKAVGLYRYATDPTTSIWMFSYRFEYGPGKYGPVLRWWRDEALPANVVAHVAAGLPVVAHNANFERQVWNNTMPVLSGWGVLLPTLEIEQMDCTMARARCLGLPGDLERAAKVVNAPVQKNKAGAEIMKKMMKPRALTFSDHATGVAYHSGESVVTCLVDDFDISSYQIGNHGVMTATWWYDLSMRRDLSIYCDDDILAECGVDVVVPALSDSERATWILDQQINDRGVMIDKPFVQQLIQIVEIAMKKANHEMWTLTGGKVKRCSEHGAVKAWLEARGIAVWIPNDEGELRTTVAKGATEDLVSLAKGMNDTVAQRVIELHNASSKASTAKFKKALAQIGSDWRARGQFSYYVASQTGRWAGAGIQLQNLVRIDEDRDLPTIRVIVEIVTNWSAQQAYDMVGMI